MGRNIPWGEKLEVGVSQAAISLTYLVCVMCFVATLHITEHPGTNFPWKCSPDRGILFLLLFEFRRMGRRHVEDITIRFWYHPTYSFKRIPDAPLVLQLSLFLCQPNWRHVRIWFNAHCSFARTGFRLLATDFVEAHLPNVSQPFSDKSKRIPMPFLRHTLAAPSIDLFLPDLETFCSGLHSHSGAWPRKSTTAAKDEVQRGLLCVHFQRHQVMGPKRGIRCPEDNGNQRNGIQGTRSLDASRSEDLSGKEASKMLQPKTGKKLQQKNKTGLNESPTKFCWAN